MKLIKTNEKQLKASHLIKAILEDLKLIANDCKAQVIALESINDVDWYCYDKANWQLLVDVTNDIENKLNALSEVI